MTSTETLSKIWTGVLMYDRKQEELLYKTLAPRMMAVCMRYARDRDEAQDILQDGFIKTFKSRELYRGEGSLEGWIRRIMAHTAISYFRKNKPFNYCEDITETTEVFAPVYYNDQLEARELLNMINQLPDTYRSVFNMYAIEGYSHQEIGDALGMSELLSRTNLCRARAVLKTKLSKMMVPQPYRMMA